MHSQTSWAVIIIIITITATVIFTNSVLFPVTVNLDSFNYEIKLHTIHITIKIIGVLFYIYQRHNSLLENVRFSSEFLLRLRTSPMIGEHPEDDLGLDSLRHLFWLSTCVLALRCSWNAFILPTFSVEEPAK